MATKITGYAPFAYDFETEGEFISFMKQRNAKYKTPAEEDFKTEDISGLDLFRNNIQAPTPQIKEIDGYDAASEIQSNNKETTETETPTDKPTDNPTDNPTVVDNGEGGTETPTTVPTDGNNTGDGENNTDNPTVDNGEGGTETPTDNPTVVDNGENNTDNPTVDNDTETQG